MPVANVSIAGRVDQTRLRATSDALIGRFGMEAVLRRVGMADRRCVVSFENWKNEELLGRQYSPLSRKCVMAAATLEGPDPVAGLDNLVTFKQPLDPNNKIEDERLKIIAPPVPLKLAGVVLQWVMAVEA